METTFMDDPPTRKFSCKSLTALHYQGNDWKRLLDFYAAELNILTNRIEVTRYMQFSITSTEVERFRSIFDMLGKKISLLKYDIQADEEKIQKLARENASHIKKFMLAVDNKKLSRIKDISTNLEALQFSVNQLITKNM